MNFFDYKSEIIKAMGSGDTVFLIGAGVSRQSGLPLWPEFIEQFIEFCKNAHCDDVEKKKALIADAEKACDIQDLGEAADLLIELISQNQFEEYIKSLKELKDIKINDLHRAILKFPCKRFLVCNYDLGIEKAHLEERRQEIKVFIAPDDEDLKRLRQEGLEEFLYKYHGCITKPETVVLSKSHYKSAIQRNTKVRDTLSTIFKKSKLVLIGFGANDYDFNQILDEIHDILGTDAIDMYAFLADVNKYQSERFKRNQGIKVITYKTRENDHSRLIVGLNEIFEEIRKVDNLRDQGLKNANLIPVPQENNLLRVNELDHQLLEIQQQLLPIDKRCLGYIKLMNGLSKEQLYEFVCDDVTPDFIDGRLLTYINANLIIETRSMYLPHNNNVMNQAALWVEDEMIARFLGELDE